MQQIHSFILLHTWSIFLFTIVNSAIPSSCESQSDQLSSNMSKISTTVSSKKPTSPTFTHLLEQFSKTEVIIKENPDFSQPLVVGHGTDFCQFIENSQIWVDKSLLIARLLCDKHATFIITAPSAWGKTTNLLMVKFFLQIPIDQDGNFTELEDSPAYNYFINGTVRQKQGNIFQVTPTPLISKFDAIWKENLGQYPIISLVGSPFDVDDYKKSFYKMIQRAYSQHSYLIEIWKKDETLSTRARDDKIAKYEFYLYPKYSDETFIKYSICHLSETLFLHYKKRKVWVLFDEAGGILNSIYFNTGATPSVVNIGAFFQTWNEFIEATFKHCTDFVHKSVITGIIRVEETTSSTKLHGVQELGVFSVEDTFPFYGIYENEFKKLSNYCNIEDSRAITIKKWFNGYTSLQHPTKHMYPIGAVMEIMNSRHIDSNVLRGTRNADIITQLKHQRSFLEKIKSMVYNHDFTTIEHRYIQRLTQSELAFLTDLRLGKTNYSGTPEQDNIIFGILTAFGYIALKNNVKKGIVLPPIDRMSVHCTIANTQYSNIISRILTNVNMQELSQKDPDSLILLNIATRNLKQYMLSTDEMLFPKLANSIGKYVNHRFGKSGFGYTQKHEDALDTNGSHIFENQTILQELLNEVFVSTLDIFAYEPTDGMRYRDQLDGTDKKVDTFMYDDTRGLLVGYQFSRNNNSMTSAFRQCIGHIALFDETWPTFESFKSIRFMAIRVNKDCVMEFMSVLLSKDQVVNIKNDFPKTKDAEQEYLNKVIICFNDISKLVVYDPTVEG